VNCYQDEEEVWMGEKCLYMDYSQVEVNETGENGMVMNDKGDGIDQMIGVETVKNGCTTNTCILEYQTIYPTLVSRQQPTLEYRLAYLHHRSTIMNKKYSKAIAHFYNWPNSHYTAATKHSISGHWKAFPHQGKNPPHLLKFVYKCYHLTKHTSASTTQLHCTALTSCNCTIETHSHIFQCPSTQQTTKIASKCLAQIKHVNSNGKSKNKWLIDDPAPPTIQIATNPNYFKAIKSQTCIRWGQFFKGFCATELQYMVNTQQDGPLNTFKKPAKSSNVCGTQKQSTGN
jgi:hypothetical protein